MDRKAPRRRPLLLDACDRILSFLPVYFGMTAREIQRRLGGEFPAFALERLVEEGYAAVDTRLPGEPPRYRFAYGAKLEWDMLVHALFVELFESGRGRTLREVAERPWPRPRWVVRAFYRLWRLGWIEREAGLGYRLAR
jgi:hypothetical protein